MCENEIVDKLGLAKRLGVQKGWLYTMNGDNPGIAESPEECEGRTVLGEIGKTPVTEMAEYLAQIRHQ